MNPHNHTATLLHNQMFLLGEDRTVDPSPRQEPTAEPTAERLRWHCFGCASQVAEKSLTSTRSQGE